MAECSTYYTPDFYVLSIGICFAMAARFVYIAVKCP